MTNEDEVIMKCPCCGRDSTTVRTRRRNTRYCDEGKNYITTCFQCFTKEEAHWKEMWDEYWSGAL